MSISYGIQNIVASVTLPSQISAIGYHWNTSSLAYEVNTGGTATGQDVNVTNFPSTFATESTLAKIPGLSIPIYDYVSASYNDGAFTETYVFKTGGSGGTTVATVIVVYVDASKAKLVSITKT